MAQFDSIFQQVIRHEGYYANLTGDQGGQTYAGIARNFHPSWRGWAIVDGYIARHGEPGNNHYIADPLLDQYVRDFYLGIWNKSLAGQINNQHIAHIYFDFYVNSRYAIREIQEVLQALGYNIAADNKPGYQTINAINSHQDQTYLHDAIKQKRYEYYHEVAQYGSNAQFLPGWLNRLADFPTLSTGEKAGVAVGAALLITFIGYQIYQQWKD
jgi:lysozyme family protein